MYSSAEAWENALARQRVLVTGAAGFIGSHLVKRLVGLGCRVVAIVRPSSDLWRIQDVLDQVEIVPSDLNQLTISEPGPILSEVQVVYHLAAAGVNQSYQNIASIVQTNVMGTLRVLQLAHMLKVGRFVYCGSCFEYGPGTLLSESSLPMPTSEYGASKAAAWMLVHTFSRRYGLPVVTLRPFTVYGPFEAGHRLIPHTIIKALNGSNIELTGGEQTRDFIFIEDVIEAFLAAAVVPTAIGGTFNVCTGLATSVKEVVLAIVDLAAESAANPVFGARLYRDTEMMTLSGDPTRAQKYLGWRAQTSLKDGLLKTIEWFRECQSRYPEYSARR